MPQTRNQDPSSVPSTTSIKSSGLVSLQNIRKHLQPESSLTRTDTPRIPVPPAAATSVTFPAGLPAQRDTLSPPQHKPAAPGLSPMTSYKRTLSSPSSPSRTSSMIPRSPLVSTGQSVDGQASSLIPSKVPSSLARNFSVPASLSHNTRQSNIPTRSTSVSHSRPSLSSPSPPTPIVPSIPLRHATQHSPAQPSAPAYPNAAPTTPNVPHSAPTTYSPVSIDRQQSSRKFFSGYSPSATSFATASDPNLPARSAPSTPVVPYEHSQYALPLKQLLSKPASPSHFHSGSESEGASQSPFGLHQRSASTSDSVQYATSPRDSDISTIEFAAVRAFQPRPSTIARTTVHKQDSNDGYHYQRTVDLGAKKGRGTKIQGRVDTLQLWSDREGKSVRSARDRGKDNTVESRPRNVLRRRPSASSKLPDLRDPASSSGPRLSRSFSASSLLKRSGLLSPRPSTVRSVSPLSKPLISPQPLLSGVPGSSRGVNSGDLHNHDNLTLSSQGSHVEDISTPLQHIDQNADIADRTDKTHDVATRFIPTTSPAQSQVSKQPSSSAVSATSGPLSPVHVDQAMSLGFATVSSDALNTKNRQFHDKWLSPAGAVADAYKREQFVKEVSKRYSTPNRPPRPPSPHLPPTIGDSDHDLQSPKPLVELNTTSKGRQGSKRSSVSDLTYADAKAGAGGVVEKPLAAGRDAGRAPGGAQLPVPEIGGGSVIKDVAERFSLVTSPHPSETRSFSRRTSSSSPLTSPPPRASSNDPHHRNRLKKVRRTSDQSDASATPYYTVVGTRTDQVYGVGGRHDSFGVGYTMLDTSTRGVRTTITAGTAAAGPEKGKERLTSSLSRKLSGKFRKDHSGGSDENIDIPRGRLTWKDGQAPPIDARPSLSKDNPKEAPDDRCLPSLYSLKKQAQSETDISGREKPGVTFPKFWRLFGRSKSKERSGEDGKVNDPPPLPALPKRYASPPNDIYSPIYSRRDRSQDPSPRTRKSPRSSKSNGPSSGRPSTATRSSTSDVPSPKLWQSTRSSVSSLDEIPPMPNPLPNLTRYATMDDADPRSPKSKVSKADSPSQNIHADPEEDYQSGNVTERSDSPPIPLFSTADVINSFPPRRSSDPPKQSPTSPNTPSPTPLPPRPARSNQRPKPVPSSPVSFGDEALYPSVMKGSTRSIPKLTFREMDSERRLHLTEKEKADRWDALLQKSDAAGGTLHFGADNDKLPSDELRFSRTLSELALDDN